MTYYAEIRNFLCDWSGIVLDNTYISTVSLEASSPPSRGSIQREGGALHTAGGVHSHHLFDR
jgi:hypothetical protein